MPDVTEADREGYSTARRQAVKCYTIKPLEWEEICRVVWVANTIFGKITVAFDAFGTWSVYFGDRCDLSMTRSTDIGAKAVATQWHNDKLELALIEQPQQHGDL